MPMHKAASGQAFEQSGQAGSLCGQQGMLSDVDAAWDLDASPIAALDGIAIGAVRRPTIARIESRRGMSDQTCTAIECHSAPHKRRVRISRSCQDANLNRPISGLVAGAGFRIERLDTGYLRGRNPMTFMYDGNARPASAGRKRATRRDEPDAIAADPGSLVRSAARSRKPGSPPGSACRPCWCPSP